MPVDFNDPEGTTTPQNEGSIFAPTPIWEQRSKVRRRGRRAMREPTPDGEAVEAADPTLAKGDDTAADSEGFVYEPIRPDHRRSGVPTIAIAAGVGAIALIGALGWYMNRPGDTGMPELTPGAPGAGEMAMAAPPLNPLVTSAPGAAPAAPMGVTPQMAAISPSREAGAPTPARSAERANRSSAPPAAASSRVRPATASSAQEEGVDASTTAPMINPPAPEAGATGPTLNMPPERIAPSLDPALPSNTGARGPSADAPIAGDVTTP